MSLCASCCKYGSCSSCRTSNRFLSMLVFLRKTERCMYFIQLSPCLCVSGSTWTKLTCQWIKFSPANPCCRSELAYSLSTELKMLMLTKSIYDLKNDMMTAMEMIS